MEWCQSHSPACRGDGLLAGVGDVLLLVLPRVVQHQGAPGWVGDNSWNNFSLKSLKRKVWCGFQTFGHLLLRPGVVWRWHLTKTNIWTSNALDSTFFWLKVNTDSFRVWFLQHSSISDLRSTSRQIRSGTLSGFPLNSPSLCSKKHHDISSFLKMRTLVWRKSNCRAQCFI